MRVLLHALLAVYGAAALDPADAAVAMANHLLDTCDRHQKTKEQFSRWVYGAGIVIDAMVEGAASVPGMEHVMADWVNPVLDEYINTEYQPAYNLSRGLPITAAFIGNAVGDKIGLFPYGYLARHIYYTAPGAPPSPSGYNASLDLLIAQRTLDTYVLKWPTRWVDGTYSRDYPGKPPEAYGNETGEHQYIWGDDVFMGLTLAARMVVHGFDDAAGTYARFVATQHGLMTSHLRPTAEEGGGVYWHGRNAKTGQPSCCKWGRGNGWIMMAHAETLRALNASSASFAADEFKKARAVFVDHATAVAAAQNVSDGRWHQLMDDPTMFLETTSTAMFTVSLTQAIDAGWLDADTFTPTLDAAWRGLSRVIHSDGYVSGQCDGFGIHPTPTDYRNCPQLYNKSDPGLGSVLRAAILLANRK